MGQIKDLRGNKFGYLTPIEIFRNAKGQMVWKCKCDCGNEIEAVSYRLTHSKIQSCGCKRKELIGQKVKKDLTGQRFGNLVVLSATEERKEGSIVWKCQCDCGNITFVPTCNLRHNNPHTTSCGCQKYKNQPALEIKGQKFGLLTPLERIDDGTRGESVWRCQCDCGNQKNVVGWYLTSHSVKSCGCLAQSYPEYKIEQILIKEGIKYETQKTFEDFILPSNRKGYFDFYLPDFNSIIEYDGEQHFLTKSKGYYTLEKIDLIKQYDQLKNQYCLNKGINLYRLNKNNINIHKIETLQELLKEEYKVGS
jgi:very-short-patch-repair endonuclease